MLLRDAPVHSIHQGIGKGVSYVVLRVDVLAVGRCGGCSGSVRDRCGGNTDFLDFIRGWSRAPDHSHGDRTDVSSDLAGREKIISAQ